MKDDPATYNRFSAHLRETFGCRVQRVAVDAGFTCPNRDGTLGLGGCIYCDDDGARADYVEPDQPIRGQVATGIERMRRRYKAGKFIVYFQAHTNTYAPVERLRALYDEALENPEVVGLMVGTRADCIGDAVLDLLEDYHRRTYFWLELGLQSTNPATLLWIGRGHGLQTFMNGAIQAKARGLRICAHLIVGMPSDRAEDHFNAIDTVNWLNIDGVKFHCLYISQGSRLASIHEVQPIPLPTRHEYIGRVCDMIERLDPRVIVHRLTSDADEKTLLGPFWVLDKQAIIEDIEAELQRRGTRQGSKYR